MEIGVIAGLALPAAVIYTVPALLAYARHLPATRRIIAIDLFLGWTLVGWAAALSMAARRRAVPGTALGSSGCHDPLGCHAAAVMPAAQGQPSVLTHGSPETSIISVWHSLN